MRLVSRLLCLLALFIQFPAYAASTEAVQAFNSQVAVNQDASIDVSETIQVQTNQQKFQYGIKRVLNATKPKDYEIRSITIDGVPTSYHVQVQNGHLNIMIGEPSQLLRPGSYVFGLTYHVQNVVHFGDDADSLTWNVADNDWGVPLNKISATLQLPDQANLITHDVYINNKPNNALVKVTQAESGVFSVETTKPLISNETLSLKTSWPKGIVQVKIYSAALKADVEAYRVNEWEFGVTLAILIYYLFFWFSIGRNLNDKNLLPLFQPPANLSAAAMRYLLKMRFTHKTFITALLSLATKQYLSFKGNHKQLSLIRHKEATAKLAHEEEVLLNALFAEADAIEISYNQRHRLRHARSQLRHALKEDFEHIYFKSNRGYIRVGIALSGIAFIVPIFTAMQHFHALMAVASLCVFGVIVYRIAKKMWHRLCIASHIPTLTHYAQAAVSIILFILAVTGSAYILGLFSNNIPPVTLFFLGMLLILNIIFYHLMRSPTEAGRDLLNQIEGFKMFFHTTEKLRFAALAPPEMTTETLDKYLPYAVAMDEEHAWGERMLQVTGHHLNAVYLPQWLTLTDSPTPTMRRFAYYITTLLMHTLHEAKG